MSEIRNDCLNLVMAVMEEKKPSHLVIADYLQSHNELGRADKNFVKKTVQGVVERAITLDYVIDCIAKTKTRKQKPAVRNILRLGAYQILYMDVPDSAACNEAVELVKKRKMAGLSGFVNGVLRNIVRQKDSYSHFDEISVRYSMPQWIVDYFVSKYGTERTKCAFDYYLSENETSIRCNSSIITPDELERSLTDRGIRVKRAAAEGSFKISGYGALGDIPEFCNGSFMVQDASSVLSGEQSDIRAGYRILDLCAAPGGKSIHAADRLITAAKAANSDDRGCVISCDVSERKVALIEENIRRCGFENIETRVNDATVLNPEFVRAFDLVICDVPCSGLGIIGKKPDIKYNMTEKGQDELVMLQRQILDNAAQYVKLGGQFVFSTCTVNEKENEGGVAYMVSKGFDVKVMRQILPGEIGTDGFFYSLLVKSSEELN